MSAPIGDDSGPFSPLSEPESPVESPAELDPATATPATTSVATDFAHLSSPPAPLRMPGIRSTSDSASPNMTSSSTPLGNVAAARRPTPQASALPAGLQAKMKAFHLSRTGVPPSTKGPASQSPASGGAIGGFSGGAFPSPSIGGPAAVGSPGPGGLRFPPNIRPQPMSTASAPTIPNMAGKPGMGGGLAAKRGMKMGMKLSDATKPAPGTATDVDGTQQPDKPKETDSLFSKYSNIVDTSTGTLNFKGKATVHGSGIDFSSGKTFKISLDEVDTLEELGKGNYGTVYQVRHSRPKFRKAGQGLAGNKAPPGFAASSATDSNGEGKKDTSGLIMAMKEIRLELDDAKFAAIIMELDILHKCISPFIVDFYGAFFQEGSVYICLEFMDGGSIDKIYGDGIPEGVLKKITLSTVLGLKELKETHNIIHRDVKPTNILVNSRGQVKICDFGVSGNLVASIAKTNIGCQSYMAPERISSGGVAQAGANPGGGTYSVQSDIWSLGLTVIECAMGRYPYPPETYNNIFSQLSAIVDGDPPDLPETGYSDTARAFVRACLRKDANLRPSYDKLVIHPWLAPLFKPPTISEDAEAEAEAEAEAAAGTPSTDASSTAHAEHIFDPASPETADPEVAAWVQQQIAKRKAGTLKRTQPPALHTAPLNAVPSPQKV